MYIFRGAYFSIGIKNNLAQVHCSIRQADGDNPITVRGRMIVKQTTEKNEKKSKLNFRKIKKVAYGIFKKNCGANWAN